MKSIDPVTKREIFIAPDGYDASKEDDKHSCDDSKPTVSGISYSASSGVISFNTTQGTFALRSIEVRVNGTSVGTVSGSASSARVGDLKAGDKVTVTVTDEGYYQATSDTYTVSGGSS